VGGKVSLPSNRFLRRYRRRVKMPATALNLIDRPKCSPTAYRAPLEPRAATSGMSPRWIVRLASWAPRALWISSTRTMSGVRYYLAPAM
jgi:hypothetical protein